MVQDRQVIDSLADKLADKFGVDAEDVRVDYKDGTVAVKADWLAQLLDEAVFGAAGSAG